jgi:small subunit ribosomal protein S2
MVKTSKKKSKETDFGIKPEEMAKAGLHFGHRASKRHPKMEPFLYGVRNNVHIIDLEKSAEKLKEALHFIQELIGDGKTILFVGTKIQVKDLVKETAIDCDMPYITDRWLGGTFTNFKTLQKRIDYFKELEKKKEAGELEKYTKKEISEIEKELQELEKKFSGIKNLTQIPEAIFVLDMKKDSLAIKEARKKGVKVVAISDTNVDPSLADYPIPANDDAISSVKYILEKVKKAISTAKKRGTKKEK